MLKNSEALNENENRDWQALVFQEITQAPNLKAGETYQQFYTRIKNELLGPIETLVDKNLPLTRGPYKGLVPVNALMLTPYSCEVFLKKLIDQHQVRVNLNDYTLPFQERREVSPLHLAAQRGKIPEIKILLEEGADLFAMTSNHVYSEVTKNTKYYTRTGFNAFAYAANEGHDAVMRLLLAHDKKVAKGDLYQRSSNRYSCMPLHLAISSGNFQAVSLLFDYGADKDIQSEWEGNYPLHVASKQGNPQILQLLMSKGAASTLTCTNRNGETPLHVAAKQGHFEAAKLLVEKGAPINFHRQSRYKHLTVLSYSFSSGNKSLILYLIEQGADIFAPSSGNLKPLHEASKLGEVDILQRLFELGAGRDIHLMTTQKEQPIHFAAAAGKAEAIKLLIAQGASLHTQTGNGRTVLHLAALSGDVPTCQLLLSKGISSYLNKTISYLGSPLHAAVRSGQQEAVQFFLAQGVNSLNLTDAGENCLHIATEIKNSKILEVLLTTSLKNQSNALTTSYKPVTPLQIAIEKQDIDSLNILLNAGADVHQVREKSKTYLHLALESSAPLQANRHDRKLEILQRLWSAMTDAEKHLTDEKGQNLLHLAADQFDLAVIIYLLNQGLEPLLTQTNTHQQTPLDVLSKHKEYSLERKLALVDLQSLRTPATEKLVDKILEILIFQFHRAVEKNNSNELEFILSKLPATVIKEHINQRNRQGETPLFIAAKEGDIKVLRLLLQAGAEVDQYSYYGRYSYDEEFAYLTPFAISVLKNHLDVAKLLYQAGASIKGAYYDATELQKEKRKTLSLDLDETIVPQGIKVEEATENRLSISPLTPREAFKKSRHDETNSWQADEKVYFRDLEKRHVFQSRWAQFKNKDFYYKSVPLLHLALKKPEGMAMAEWLLSLEGVSINETDEAGFTALQRAIERNNEKAIHFLIDHQADANKGQAPISPPLTMAISKPVIVELLLKAGANPNPQDKEVRHQAPLFAALKGNHDKSLRLLLDYQADIHFTVEGETPLMIAVKGSKLKVMKWLLKAGANIHAVDFHGRTALFYAFEAQDKDKVAVLLKQGSFVNQIALGGNTPLILAAQSGSKELIEILLAHGANLHHLTNNQANALIETVKKGHLEAAELLIERGCHIQPQDKEGASALFIAASNGNTALVELLLRHGADPHAPNKQGVTPLLVAAQGDPPSLTLIKLLLEQGASTQIPVPLRHYHFDNVIYAVVKENNLTFLKELFNKGITLQKEEHQKSDIHLSERKNFILMACKNNSLEMVELLHQHGADINQVSISSEDDSYRRKRTYTVSVSYSYGRPSYYDSDTNVYYPESVNETREEEYFEKGERYTLTLRPIHVAVQENNLKLVELLVKLGANLNEPITPDDGVCPLHLALTLKLYDIAAILIEQGAEINQPCETIQHYSQRTRQYKGAPTYSFTPLLFAIQEDNKELAETLIKKGANNNQSIRFAGNVKESPVYLAAKRNDSEMVTRLLKAGSSINGKPKQPNVLLVAAANKNDSLVNQLIMADAYLTLLPKEMVGLRERRRSQQAWHDSPVALTNTKFFPSTISSENLENTDDLLKYYVNYYSSQRYQRDQPQGLQILILLALFHEAFIKGELSLAKERLQRAFVIAQDKLINFFEFILQGKLISDCYEEEIMFISNEILELAKSNSEQYQKVNFIMAFHIFPSVERYPAVDKRMLTALSYLLAAGNYPGAQLLKSQAFNQLLGGKGLAITQMSDLKIDSTNFDKFKEVIEDIYQLKEERKSQSFSSSAVNRFGLFNYSQKQIKKLPLTKEYSSHDDMLRTKMLGHQRRHSFS